MSSEALWFIVWWTHNKLKHNLISGLCNGFMYSVVTVTSFLPPIWPSLGPRARWVPWYRSVTCLSPVLSGVVPLRASVKANPGMHPVRFTEPLTWVPVRYSLGTERESTSYRFLRSQRSPRGEFFVKFCISSTSHRFFGVLLDGQVVVRKGGFQTEANLKNTHRTILII